MSKIDYLARIFHYIRIVNNNLLLVFFSTMLSRIVCRLKGIKLGQKVRFYGLPYFQRIENSIITVGNECQFRSKMTSNLIGIRNRCIVSTSQQNAAIEIGENCGLSGTVIRAARSISIGNNVRCGANTTIYDNDGHLDDKRSNFPKPIVIKDNVWLGYNVVVMKGVTIGENSVIGANSLVTKDIPANVVAAGNPCRVIRELKK
jgi:acetyltransferase-like isoleucine patch superfamily enzyme